MFSSIGGIRRKPKGQADVNAPSEHPAEMQDKADDSKEIII
jgi:hypothetical protein